MCLKTLLLHLSFLYHIPSIIYIRPPPPPLPTSATHPYHCHPPLPPTSTTITHLFHQPPPHYPPLPPTSTTITYLYQPPLPTTSTTIIHLCHPLPPRKHSKAVIKFSPQLSSPSSSTTGSLIETLSAKAGSGCAAEMEKTNHTGNILLFHQSLHPNEPTPTITVTLFHVSSSLSHLNQCYSR
ncbi:hypothetical protein Hdeb2414_s0007g00240531 [Helianthus debilis subsp. tardiflorus]